MLASEMIIAVRRIAKKDCPACSGTAFREYPGEKGLFLCVPCLGEEMVTSILNYIAARLRGEPKSKARRCAPRMG